MLFRADGADRARGLGVRCSSGGRTGSASRLRAARSFSYARRGRFSRDDADRAQGSLDALGSPISVARYATLCGREPSGCSSPDRRARAAGVTARRAAPAPRSRAPASSLADGHAGARAQRTVVMAARALWIGRSCTTPRVMVDGRPNPDPRILCSRASARARVRAAARGGLAGKGFVST